MSHRIERQKQNRVTVACDNCRQRKIRCDAGKPVCKRCNELGSKCEYTPSERQLMSDARFSAIHERLDHVDETMSSLASSMKVIVSKVNGLLAESSGSMPSKPAPRDPNQFENENHQSSAVLKPPMQQIPQFNDRLSHMKIHTNGDQVSTTVYLSSVFLSILSPKDIDFLVHILNDSLLPERLEAVSYNVWWKTQDAYRKLAAPSNDCNEFQPDASLLDVGMTSSRERPHHYVKTLLPAEEIDLVEWTSLAEPLANGLRAAMIIVGCLNVKNKPGYGGFAKDLVVSQERAAYFQAIRTLNWMRFSTPSFFSVRVAILLSLFLVICSNVPGVFNLVDIIVDMCKAIKLDRPEVQRKYPREMGEWREHVWFMGSNLMYCYYITLYLKPSGITFTSSDLSQTVFGRPDLADQRRMVEHAMKIHQIYDMTYEQLFRISSRNCSPDELLNDIRILGKELRGWGEGFSWDSTKIHFSKTFSDCNDFLSMFQLGNLYYKYFHTTIAVYSIPAFYPSCLPEVVPNALDLVSSAARELYKIGLMSEEMGSECTAISTVAVTPAVCTLLYKQLCYPTHESNSDDLKLLKDTIHRFDRMRWPLTSGRTPQGEIWQVLLDIMERHYQLHNVSAESEIIAEKPAAAYAQHDLLAQEYVDEMNQCIVI